MCNVSVTIVTLYTRQCQGIQIVVVWIYMYNVDPTSLLVLHVAMCKM